MKTKGSAMHIWAWGVRGGRGGAGRGSIATQEFNLVAARGGAGRGGEGARAPRRAN